MAVGLSSLAQVCSAALPQQLSAGINAADRSRVDVLLGTPAAATPTDTDTNHRLNLFFSLRALGFRRRPVAGGNLAAAHALPGDALLC